ncbi:MAG TPA: formate dehydrogenase subunit alpha [Xanthobacteraceae bacterium]|nr:formate dehydrogenase subunit alpha [Xanthobacteraceae bacterium]
MSTVKTVCPYCGTGCSMMVHTRDGRISEVTPDKSHPVSQGELCLKGYYGFNHVADRRRLTTPLRREGGAFVPVTWDEALDAIAAKFAAIRRDHGPDAFAMFASARCTNEDNYVAQKFARAVMGTNNVDHCARLCHSSTVAGLAQTLGSGAMTNSIPEIGEVSDLVFIIGSNTAEQHPLIARHVIRAQQRGAKLIVADPRRTEMAEKADLWVRVPPGHNIPLVNGMLHVLVQEGLYDKEFVAQHSVGFDDVARAIEPFSPEAVERMSGIPASQVVQAAHMYGRARAAAILYAMGITQFSHGVGNVVSLSNLAVISGQIGRPGAGVCPLRGQGNVQGACDLGALPNVYPAYLPVTDAAVRARFEQAWGVTLPAKVGLKVTDVPEAIERGDVRALLVFGENPVMTDPDSGALRQQIQKLELLVVMDLFMTETARFADIVLPAACWAEKDGTYTNTERRVQRGRAVVAPPGEARVDWTVFGALASRLGYAGLNYASAQDIWDEVRRVVPAPFGGISYARLDQEPGLSWPCPSEDHPGTPILHKDGHFALPSGKAQLVPVLFDPDTLPDAKAQGFSRAITGHVVEHADAAYPFILNTGRRVYNYHTGTMTRKSPLLEQLAPEERIELNPQDARELGVADGDFVKLTTRRGHTIARAWLTERVAPKNVFSTFHYWEANSNELTNAHALDPISGIPEYKVSAAKVEKSTAADAKAWRERAASEYRLGVERATNVLLAGRLQR